MPVDVRTLCNSFFTRADAFRSEAANYIPECIATGFAGLALFFAPLRSFSSSLLAKAKQKPFQAGALGAGAVGAVALLILGHRVYQDWKRDPKEKALDQWIESAPTEEEKGARLLALGAMRGCKERKNSELYVGPWGLTSLPDEIGSPELITGLILEGNCFEIIPSPICALKNLESIDLGHNQLQKISSDFCGLTKLKKIWLEHNQIKALPEEMGQLTQLEMINLNDNQLETLPKSFSNLEHLKEIYLLRNQFKEIPPMHSSNATIHIDILDQSELPEEPKDSAKPPIRFYGTYQSVCEQQEAYHQFIGALKSWIQEVDGCEEYSNRCKAAYTMRECYKKVKDLSQYSKSVDHFKPGSTQYGDLNLTLDLSGLKLTSLPPVIGKLTGRGEVDAPFGNTYFGVNTLMLAGNKFSNFPEAILELEGLQYLYLWGNPIENLPADLPKTLGRLLLIHVCVDHLESGILESFTEAKIIHTQEKLTQEEYNQFSRGRTFKVNSTPI